MKHENKLKLKQHNYYNMLFYLLTVILYTAILHKIHNQWKHKIPYHGNYTVERHLICDEPICIL